MENRSKFGEDNEQKCAAYFFGHPVDGKMYIT